MTLREQLAIHVLAANVSENQFTHNLVSRIQQSAPMKTSV